MIHAVVMYFVAEGMVYVKWASLCLTSSYHIVECEWSNVLRKEYLA